MISSLYTVPEGLAFQPRDKVLLSHYLTKKNQGKDAQITIIPVIDVSKHEPRDLPALVFTRVGSGDRVWLSMAEEWHFFRPRNSCKTTREGFWKQQGKPHGIKAPGSKAEIGGKRILVFHLHGEPKIRTDWVIHEYFLPQGDFVLCRLRNKSDEFDHAPICDQAPAEPASGSCSVTSNVENQAAENGMTEEAEENHLASKQPCSGGYHMTPSPLEIQAASNFMDTEAEDKLTFTELLDALQIPNVNGFLTGSFLDKNQLSNSVEGQPDSYNSSDSFTIEEFFDDHEPVNLDSIFPQPQPPQPYQLPQPPPPQDYRPQSPISTKLGMFHMERLSMMMNADYDEPVNNTSSNSENQAAQWIPEGHSTQPGANLELGIDSFQPQGYDSAPSSIYGGPGDFSDYNDLIGLDELLSSLEDTDSSPAKSSDLIIDGGSGVSSDRNTEVSVKQYSALAIGAEQPSNVNELP
ncbi:hypothetical protein M0R45_034033 [Rubus argutus]|uniref:NAC domain-containing protein n=1 Tax=Rubus argutus TaxID=59490 RepID=A0AAW1VT42_RUBAR